VRTERQIQQAIVKAITDSGGKVYKLHGSAFSVVGAPDLIGSAFGFPVALEVKRPGEKPTPKQVYELNEWARRGWLTGVVTSVQDLMNLIQERRSNGPPK